MSTAIDFRQLDSVDERASFLNIISIYKLMTHRSEHRMLDELYELAWEDPNCFERREEEGAKHIAASVFLMRPEDHRALFMWHQVIGRWTQPGGHADGDANIHRVALREVEEEVGVVCTDLLSPFPFEIHRFDYPKEVFGYTKSIYNLFFMAMLPTGQQPRILEPRKCGELRWANVEEAKELVRSIPHDGYVRLLEKWDIELSRMRV